MPSPTSTQEIKPKDDILAYASHFTVENGTVSFPTYADLAKVKDRLNVATENELQALFSKFNFKSQFEIEQELLRQLEGADENQINNLQKDYSVIFDFENQILKNPYRSLIRLLNKDGFLMLGKSLMKFDDLGEILILNGDMEAMQRSLLDRKSLRPDNNIAIVKPTPQIYRAGFCPKDRDSDWFFNSDGNRRAKMSIRLPTSLFADPATLNFWVQKTELGVTVQAQKKNSLRIWTSVGTEHSLTVNTDIRTNSFACPVNGVTPTRLTNIFETAGQPDGSIFTFTKEVPSFNHALGTQFCQFVIDPAQFIFYDMTYSNRGGVNFTLSCN